MSINLLDEPVSSEICGLPTRSEIAPTGITSLRADLAKWLSMPAEDQDLVDVSLAVYKSHEIPGDPLWAIIIDASGAGKTELLRAFRERPGTHFLSSLTENSLVSGYRDPKNPGKDVSLLPQLDGKVVIIKDLAPLMGLRPDSRSAVMAGLREAYDGFTDQAKGNLGMVSYSARFTLLAASTLAIERADSIEQELGERFIKFRARGNGDKDKVRRAIRNIGADLPMRNEIGRAVSNFLDALPVATNRQVPCSLWEPLANLADSTAKSRSHVSRDRQGSIQYLPRPEVGTRLAKELGKLLIALSVVRGKPEPDQEDFDTVVRVAEDCLPPNRIAVLNLLRLRKDSVRPSEIEEITMLPRTTISRTLEDLAVLGVVTSTGEPAKSWKLVNDWKSKP